MTGNKVAVYAALFIALLALALAAFAVIQPAEQAEDADIGELSNVPIYFEQGGAKLVIGSGGELEAQAGSTLDFTTGTVTVGTSDFTATDPLTITGVLTDVVLLFEQQ